MACKIKINLQVHDYSKIVGKWPFKCPTEKFKINLVYWQKILRQERRKTRFSLYSVIERYWIPSWKWKFPSKTVAQYAVIFQNTDCYVQTSKDQIATTAPLQDGLICFVLHTFLLSGYSVHTKKNIKITLGYALKDEFCISLRCFYFYMSDNRNIEYYIRIQFLTRYTNER